MPQIKTFASVALILALATAPALAADDQHEQHHPGGSPPAAATTPGMGQGMQGGMMGGGMMAGMGGMPMMGMMRMMEGHVEGRIAFLKTELKITDAQLPLWNAVADAIRASAKTGMGMMDCMGMAQAGKLPERLAAREKAMTERLEAMRKLKTAIDPFYAALTDEQKKTADDMLMSPMGMM